MPHDDAAVLEVEICGVVIQGKHRKYEPNY